MRTQQMFLRSFWLLVLLAGLISSLSMSAAAQSTTDGAIGGTVTDQTGATVPDASVSAQNVGTNAKSSTKTDSNGGYRIIRLQPGRYTVEIIATGFGKYSLTNVTVEIGRITAVDAQLSVAGQVETVLATAEAPVIETQRNDYSTNINQISMNELPINGRRWSTFALGTPGATADGGFGLVSFRGISGLLNNNTVDGGDNNQAFFSEERGRTRIGYSISQSSIQEFQVNTSNFSSEYGRAAGGVVNAVTKSGTNNFHGQAFYFIRDNAWGTQNPFLTQTVNVNGTFTQVFIKPQDRRQQFGGNLGGPIVKDKFFFFFNYDQQKRNFPGVAAPGNPSAFFAALSASEVSTLSGRGITSAQQAAGLAFLQGMTGVVPRTGDQYIIFPKADWKISSNHTLTLSYNRLRWNSPAGIQTGGVVFRGVDSFGNDFVQEDWGIARLTSSFSPSVTNEFRFQYGRDFEFENTQPAIAGEPVAPQSGFSPQIGISGGGGLTFGKPNFLDRRAFPDEKRQQYADTVSVSHGKHQIKFGTDITRANDLMDNLFQEGGVYNYSNRVDFITDFTNIGSTTATQRYSSFQQGFGPTAFTFATWDYAVFFQDDFHILPRVTLNLGLRYEYERMPKPQIPNPLLPATSVFPSDKNNFGPRVGFAWDLSGKGKSVIRGGYGIYYGRIINSTIANAITNTGVTTGQLSFTIRPSATAPRYPNILTTAPPPAIGTPDVVVFAPNTQSPKIHEFDAVFEQQVATNTVISISYLGSLGRELPIFLDRNLPASPAATLNWTAVGGPFDGQTFTLPLYQDPRPNPNFARITTISDIVNSKYNALAVSFNRRFTNGLQFQIGYTYSRVSDSGQSSQTFTASNNSLDVNNLALEQGRSNFDIRHRFGASAVWQPNHFQKQGGLAHYLLDGFTISPIVSAASGAPLTATISGNPPTCTPPVVCLPFLKNSTGIIAAGGTNRPPWIARNGFQNPRTANVDMRISRRFSIRESMKFEVLAEAFNLFNHVNVTSVDNLLYSTCGSSCTSPTAPTLSFNKPSTVPSVLPSGFLAPQSSSNSLIAQRLFQLGVRFEF